MRAHASFFAVYFRLVSCVSFCVCLYVSGLYECPDCESLSPSRPLYHSKGCSHMYQPKVPTYAQHRHFAAQYGARVPRNACDKSTRPTKYCFRTTQRRSGVGVSVGGLAGHMCGWCQRKCEVVWQGCVFVMALRYNFIHKASGPPCRHWHCRHCSP